MGKLEVLGVGWFSLLEVQDSLAMISPLELQL